LPVAALRYRAEVPRALSLPRFLAKEARRAAAFSDLHAPPADRAERMAPCRRGTPAALSDEPGAEAQARQGLITAAPVSAKSATLRVTTVRPWTTAVAAMRESMAPRVRIAAIRPHSTAIASSIPRIRDSYS